MTINERIKFLRKEKGLNQKQFASLLGITQSGTSYMEQPGNNVSDSSIKSICTICNVNEEWLRNGIEPIHIDQDTFSLDEYAKQKGATELELQIVKTYFGLDPDTRKALLELFKKSLSAPVPTEKEKTVEELEAEYKKSVLRSAAGADSTISSTTGDTEHKASGH